jgi:hypothetical protein
MQILIKGRLMVKNKDLNTLEHGEYFEFNPQTGIARRNHEYFVFHDYMFDKSREGLGYLIGRGLSPEDALRDAFVNLNKKMSLLVKKTCNAIAKSNFDPYESFYGNKKNIVEKVFLCPFHGIDLESETKGDENLTIKT